MVFGKMEAMAFIDAMKAEALPNDTSPVSDDSFFQELLVGKKLGSLDGLVAVLEKIRDDHLIYPDALFFQLHNRPPIQRN